MDTTLTFAARRHIPTRYSRDLVAKTLSAMQRVEEIRRRRERVFYRNRMAGNKERERAANKKLVEENQHLLPPDQRTVVPEKPVAVTEDAMDLSEEEVSEFEDEKPVMVPVKIGGKKKMQKVAAGRMDVD